MLRANGQRALYDAVADPGELRDIAEDFPEEAARLEALARPRLAPVERIEAGAGAVSVETGEALRALGVVVIFARFV